VTGSAKSRSILLSKRPLANEGTVVDLELTFALMLFPKANTFGGDIYGSPLNSGGKKVGKKSGSRNERQRKSNLPAKRPAKGEESSDESVK